MPVICLSIAMIGLLGLIQPARAATASYHIGNSLTWDSQPPGVAAFAADDGLSHDVGYHIRTGKALNYIRANPDDASGPPADPVAPYGKYANALPNFDWDMVTIQPHPGVDSTLATDTQAILDFIADARSDGRNTDTRFYIYAAWAGHADFQTTWTASSADADATPTIQSRDYFTNLIERVRAQTDATVFMVPVGEVLFTLSQLIDNDQLPDVDALSDLYRDDIHMDWGAGRYIAGLTTYSTLFATDPDGERPPTGHYPTAGSASLVNFTPSGAFYDAVNQAAWDVVSNHAYSGVPEPGTLALVLPAAWAMMRRPRSVPR